MRKSFLILVLLATSFIASAFEFDGIDLNTPYSNVTREIAKRGYSYDHDRNCLAGNCQGMQIYLSINYVDVRQPGMLGQLIIDMPVVGSEEQALANYMSLLNVLYHQVQAVGEPITYLVDKDGTTLTLFKKQGFVELIYNGVPPTFAPKVTIRNKIC